MFMENLVTKNQDCRPIKIDGKDSFYNGTTDCLHYAKSIESFDQCNISTTSSPINGHDPFINLELIFNEKAMNHLANNKGLFDINNTQAMKEIFVGFDERSMQIPGLMMVLHFFAQFYNKMFAEIIGLKPSLGIEGSKSEARKITTAIEQKLMVDLVKSVIR